MLSAMVMPPPATRFSAIARTRWLTSRSLELGHGDKDLLFNAAVVYNDLGETGVALDGCKRPYCGIFFLGRHRIRLTSTISEQPTVSGAVGPRSGG